MNWGLNVNILPSKYYHPIIDYFFILLSLIDGKSLFMNIKSKGMKPIKIYCIKCNKFRSFIISKNLYIFNNTIVPTFISGKCGEKNHRKFKEEESIVILWALGLNEQKCLVLLIEKLDWKIDKARNCSI